MITKIQKARISQFVELPFHEIARRQGEIGARVVFEDLHERMVGIPFVQAGSDHVDIVGARAVAAPFLEPLELLS